MKNTSNINSQRQSSSSSSSSGRFFGPQLNFPLRQENQWLRAGDVLARVRQQLAGQARFAKCAGLSVWVTFPEAPAESVRFQLSQLGFSWVSSRQSWQHPCGQFESPSAV